MTKHHEMVTRPSFGTLTWGKAEKPFSYTPSEAYAILDDKSFESLYDERLRALIGNNTAA